MTNKTDVLSGRMNFHEWMEVSEKIIGKEGMAIFARFVVGEIPFDECLEQVYKVFPPENYDALASLVNKG